LAWSAAIGARETFLGNVIISAASGLPQAYIAVPVFSEGNKLPTDLMYQK
jgi:hypothetical protein